MIIFFVSMAHHFSEHSSQAVSRESVAALIPLEKSATLAQPLSQNTSKSAQKLTGADSLHMLQIQLGGLDAILMDLLAVSPGSISPACHSAFIELVGVHDGLNWTAIREQDHHNDNELGWLAQSLQHGSSTRAQGVTTAGTAIALSLAIMNDDVACPGLPSCATRRIGAKLFRRIH